MKKVKFVNILFSFGNEANSKSHDKQKTGRRINVQVMAMSRRKYMATRGKRPVRTQLYVDENSGKILHFLPLTNAKI